MLVIVGIVKFTRSVAQAVALHQSSAQATSSRPLMRWNSRPLWADKLGAKGKGMAGDPELVGADRRSALPEGLRLFGVVVENSRSIGVQNGQLARQGIQLHQSGVAVAAAGGSLKQFGLGDE